MTNSCTYIEMCDSTKHRYNNMRQSARLCPSARGNEYIVLVSVDLTQFSHYVNPRRLPEII